MEQNLPVIVKKVWSLMQVMFFMLKKNISKPKLFFADFNIIIKRGKIAGKALHNLLFHHHHHWAATTTTIHRRPHHLSASHSPPEKHDGDHEMIITPAVMKALEMLTSAAVASPVAGFGKSPKVKQLRITDSPFPLNNGDDDGKVDEAAEKFIMRFYNDLRRQN